MFQCNINNVYLVAGRRVCYNIIYTMISSLQVEECDDKDDIEREGMGGIIRRRHLYEIIDCEDPNGNTPLSECAGQLYTIFSYILTVYLASK